MPGCQRPRGLERGRSLTRSQTCQSRHLPHAAWTLPAPREPKLANKNQRPSTRLEINVDGVFLQSEFVFSLKLE